VLLVLGRAGHSHGPLKGDFSTLIQGCMSRWDRSICTHSLNLINRMPIEKIHHFRLMRGRTS